jgi:hypothetical protein
MKVQTKQIELYGSKNPEKNLIQQARLLEDTSLRGLHRVISRCVQALAVVDLLHSLQTNKGNIQLIIYIYVYICIYIYVYIYIYIYIYI